MKKNLAKNITVHLNNDNHNISTSLLLDFLVNLISENINQLNLSSEEKINSINTIINHLKSN